MRAGELARARRVFRRPRVRGRANEDWARLARFCVVGGSGYVVNLAVFATLVDLAGVHYALAAVVAFCVAVSNNFLLNKYWTFQRHEESAGVQGIRYLLVSLVALGLNLLILQLLVLAQTPEIAAQAVAVIAVTPINFLMNHRWTFLDREDLLGPRSPDSPARKSKPEGESTEGQVGASVATPSEGVDGRGGV